MKNERMTAVMVIVAGLLAIIFIVGILMYATDLSAGII